MDENIVIWQRVMFVNVRQTVRNQLFSRLSVIQPVILVSDNVSHSVTQSVSLSVGRQAGRQAGRQLYYIQTHTHTHDHNAISTPSHHNNIAFYRAIHSRR